MIEALQKAGFRKVRACHFFDSFAGTSKVRVAGKYQVKGTNFMAFK